jgi:hypothetical protein
VKQETPECTVLVNLPKGHRSLLRDVAFSR